MHWYLEVLKKYVTFSGRASRPEFWWFFLINLVISIALVFADLSLGLEAGGIGITSTIYQLAVLLPSLAVSVRRLHDTDRSGWWFLISFVPLIGLIVLLVFFVLAGTPGENRHGPNPSEAKAEA